MTLSRGSRMKTVLKKRFLLVAAIVFVFCAVAIATVARVLVMDNPVLFINEAAGAEVFVDGERLDFEEGFHILYPWKLSYLVEVDTPTGRYKRRIYPWQGSDSAHVVVREDEVSFYVRSIVAE